MSLCELTDNSKSAGIARRTSDRHKIKSENIVAWKRKTQNHYLFLGQYKRKCEDVQKKIFLLSTTSYLG